MGTAQPVESFAQVLQGISRDLETTRAAKQHPLHAHTAAPSLAFAPSTSATSTEPQAGLPLLPYPSSLTATATPPINNIFGTDGINDQFFRDLGLPPMVTQDAGGSSGANGAVGGGFGGAGDGGWGAPSTFDFWSGAGGVGGTDTTPPDFAFLSGTNDWGAGGQVLDFSAQDPNSLAANALLDQLAGTW